MTIASEWMSGPDLRDGQVCRVLDEWRLPAVDLWAVYPGGRMDSVKARTFIDVVEQLLPMPPQAAVAGG